MTSEGLREGGAVRQATSPSPKCLQNSGGIAGTHEDEREREETGKSLSRREL